MSTGSKKMIGEHVMPLMTVVITLAVVGLLLWLVNRFIPMQGTIKGILNAIVVIVVVVWIVNIFGLMHYITQFHVGQ
ncbi:MAG: Thivi_2564 family membrane protein [Terracidiphilus sp.]